MVMLWNIVQRNYQNFFYYMGMIRLQKTSTPKTFAGNILVRIFFGWDKSCQSCELKKWSLGWHNIKAVKFGFINWEIIVKLTEH